MQYSFYIEGVTLFFSAYLICEIIAQGTKRWKWKRGLLIAVFSYLLLGIFALWPIPIIAGIFVLGLILDTCEEMIIKKSWMEPWSWLIFRFIYLIGLVLMTGIFVNSENLNSSIWVSFLGEGYYQGVIVLTGAYSTIWLGARFMSRSIQPFIRLSTEVDAADPDGAGVPGGGKVIGQFERLLIFVAVLTNAASAVGFLIAAKSILRFGESSKDRKNAEYIIIGTLMSFSYAILFSLLTRYALMKLG